MDITTGVRGCVVSKRVLSLVFLVLGTSASWHGGYAPSYEMTSYSSAFTSGSVQGSREPPPPQCTALARGGGGVEEAQVWLGMSSRATALLDQRMSRLEKENENLRKEVDALKSSVPTDISFMLKDVDFSTLKKGDSWDSPSFSFGGSRGLFIRFCPKGDKIATDGYASIFLLVSLMLGIAACWHGDNQRMSRLEKENDQRMSRLEKENEHLRKEVDALKSSVPTDISFMLKDLDFSTFKKGDFWDSPSFSFGGSRGLFIRFYPKGDEEEPVGHASVFLFVPGDLAGKELIYGLIVDDEFSTDYVFTGSNPCEWGKFGPPGSSFTTLKARRTGRSPPVVRM